MAALAGEGDKALQDIGEEQLEPPTPFDKGEHNPGPDDKVVSFDSIAQNRDAAQEPEKDSAGQEQEKVGQEPPAAEDQAPAKKRGGRPSKDSKDEKTPDKPTSPEYIKALDKYEKELAEWKSKEPWEREAEPPKRPKPPRAPKKERKAAADKINDDKQRVNFLKKGRKGRESRAM